MGDVSALLFEDASFSIVTCRYTLHHRRHVVVSVVHGEFASLGLHPSVPRKLDAVD
ncbi:MAG: hypothetical protein M5U12_24675 [Verrucomicrobia bacterium]|nr:hypothetical protein [Verrucomicrobiota bacterium]